jgi:hypothetical protein
VTFTTLAGNTKGTETTGSKLSNFVLVIVKDIFRNGVVFLDSLENEKRGTLDTDNALTSGGLNNGNNLLGNGVKGVELNNLVLGKGRLGTGVELKRLEEGLVNGIKTLLLTGSSETGSKHQIISLNTLNSVGLSKGKLVLGKSTSLVGTENFDTGKGLNSRKLLDNSLLLGKVGSTDSHGSGNDSGETDGDTNNGNSKSVSKNLNNRVRAVKGSSPNNKEGNNNENKKSGTNTVKDLSEMTRTSRSLVDKGSSTTDEGVITSGSNNHKGLTTLDSRRSVGVVTNVLVNSKRLTSNSRLINLEEAVLSNETTISGNNSTFLELEEITGDNLGGLNLLDATITENNSTKGKSLLQLLDNRTGLEFLNETNSSVKTQKTKNDTKIDPVFKTGGKDSSGLHDELNGTDEKHEELDNEGFLLLRHLVPTKLLSASKNLIGGQTDRLVSLKKFLRNRLGRVASSGLFLEEVISTMVGLEFFNEGVDIVVFFIIRRSKGSLLQGRLVRVERHLEIELVKKGKKNLEKA